MLTIPKLELCAALLLSQLFQQISKDINLNFNKVFLWSDSEIVLHWINNNTSNLKDRFVSNRIKKIQGLGDVKFWRHVRSADNPADCLSRGQLPSPFINNNI